MSDHSQGTFHQLHNRQLTLFSFIVIHGFVWQLLEQQPFADADESYFVEEEYGAVSALLGERAKPFLAIPLGPLQVGHFIGSLVFVLMAFVEYPGFPLTNLPTPLRDCFQGGSYDNRPSGLMLLHLFCQTFTHSRFVSLLYRTSDRLPDQHNLGRDCFVSGTCKRPTGSSLGNQDVYSWWIGVRPIHATTNSGRNR